LAKTKDGSQVIIRQLGAGGACLTKVTKLALSLGEVIAAQMAKSQIVKELFYFAANFARMLPQDSMF